MYQLPMSIGLYLRIVPIASELGDHCWHCSQFPRSIILIDLIFIFGHDWTSCVVRMVAEAIQVDREMPRRRGRLLRSRDAGITRSERFGQSKIAYRVCDFSTRRDKKATH